MKTTEANLTILRGRCRNLPRPSFCHGVEWIPDDYGPWAGVEFPKVNHKGDWCRKCHDNVMSWWNGIRGVTDDCANLPDNGEIREVYWWVFNDGSERKGARVWEDSDGWKYFGGWSCLEGNNVPDM